MKIEELSAWEAFLGVAKHGNFSKAAKALRVPLPQVSKRISKLESQLEVRLFNRTTRVVSLTSEGKALLPKINSIIEDLKEVEDSFEKEQNLSGTIKVTSVPFVAKKLLLPTLNEFTKKHPKIHIELELSKKFMNIVESGFDMAIRIESPKDSDLVYRKLAPNDLIFCATPTYLKSKKKKPKTPEDLKDHDLLMLSIHRRCKFINSDIKLREFEKSKKITCENGVFLTEMALNSMGILVRAKLDVEDKLKTGELVQVLKNHPLETFGHIYAVIPNKRYLAPRVRAFLDFVVDISKKRLK